MTRTIPDIARIEQDGFLIVPRGWAATFEHRLAAMAAYILDLPVTYESGRRVHRNRLVRGLLGMPEHASQVRQRQVIR